MTPRNEPYHSCRVLPKLILCSGLVVVSVTLAAQGSVSAVDVTGEHRMVTSDTPESARRFALADAHRRGVEAIANALAARVDLAALQLTPTELRAYVAALMDTQSLESAGANAAPTVRISVRAQLDTGEAVRRLPALRKDEEASRTVVAAWTRSEQLREQLAGLTRQRAAMTQGAAAAKVLDEQLRTMAALNVERLVARGAAALARTEPSTIGGRAPSAEGRRRARESADQALAIAPEAAAARVLLGDIFIDAEQPEPAEAEYRRALAADPTSASVRTRLAEALRLQGKFPESIEELRETIRIAPGFSQAHSDLAMILRADGKLAEAEAGYREAIRLDPRNADAHNGLAITYANSKRLEDAAREFEAIIAIDPDSTIGYYNLATVLANLDKDIESAAALRQVLRINPDHYNARFNLGELLRLEGKFDDSATQFREYLRLAPDTPQNRRNIERARRYVQQFTNP